MQAGVKAVRAQDKVSYPACSVYASRVYLFALVSFCDDHMTMDDVRMCMCLIICICSLICMYETPSAHSQDPLYIQSFVKCVVTFSLHASKVNTCCLILALEW